MRIAVIGATGWLGGAIAREALARGHEVTAIGRDAQKLAALEGVNRVAVNATEADSLAERSPATTWRCCRSPTAAAPGAA